MKKWLIVFIICILAIISWLFYNYKIAVNNQRKIIELNKEYESYTEGEITGISLITLINKTVDLNKKNNVKTDENDLFVDNNTNSIRIDIKFLESDTVFPMEKIEKLGSNLFVKNYAGISFKCTKKEYHEKNNMIKYMYFEEI